jgi:hypothetical protein
MATRHGAFCSLKFLLPRNAITLDIGNDEGKLGTIKIGQGGIYWTPCGKHAATVRLSWSKLAELLNSLGKK